MVLFRVILRGTMVKVAEVVMPWSSVTATLILPPARVVVSTGTTSVAAKEPAVSKLIG